MTDLLQLRRAMHPSLDAEESLAAGFWRQVMADLNDSQKRRTLALAWLTSEDFYWWASTSLDLHDHHADDFRARLIAQAQARKSSAFCLSAAHAV